MQIDICTPQRSLTFVGMLTEVVKQRNILINCMHECENFILYSYAFRKRKYNNNVMHSKCVHICFERIIIVWMCVPFIKFIWKKWKKSGRKKILIFCWQYNYAKNLKHFKQFTRWKFEVFNSEGGADYLLFKCNSLLLITRYKMTWGDLIWFQQPRCPKGRSLIFATFASFCNSFFYLVLEECFHLATLCSRANFFQLFVNILQLFVNLLQLFANPLQLFANLLHFFANLLWLFANLLQLFTNLMQIFGNLL